jgi:hypothetical protein
MAAAAAAAARKKNDAVPPGGNGVLAAAAASNKNKTAARGTKDETMKDSSNPDSVLAAIRLQRSGSNGGIGERESKAATLNERKTWDSERYNSKGEGDTTGAKSPFGVMASNYRMKKDGGEDGARRKKKDPNAGKSEFSVAAARLKKRHSDTGQVAPRSAYAKKVGAKDVPSAAKKVGAKEAPPAGEKPSFSSSAAAYRRKKTKQNFDVEDLESDEEEQSAKWMKPKEHADAQDIRSKSVEAAREPTKAVEPAAKNASEGDEIEPSATPPVEEIDPAAISEEVKANVGADTKDKDADNKSHTKLAADLTEINLFKEDSEIEKNDNKASEERIKSAADSAEIKPTDDADTKDNGAEATNIDVSADIEPKEDSDTHDDHTNNKVQNETDADSSSVVEPSLEASEQTKSSVEIAAKYLPVPLISPLASPVVGRESLAIVGGLFSKAARFFDKDCVLDDDDEDVDYVDSSSRDIRSEMLRNNFDDSSVAQMAGTLEQQPISSRLSETWTKGDTIQNWSGWANQVITASDTDSVAGFEASMDLRDEGDFDDESTIATFMDNNTIASATPGYNNPLYGDVPLTPGRVGQSISFEMPSITPAEVAASILFSDSPATSVENTPTTANGGRGTTDIVLDAGLAFPANDIGLDAGLSFGGDHLDCDDGLGFGFGGAGGLSPFGGPPVEDDKSTDKKKWFPW